MRLRVAAVVCAWLVFRPAAGSQTFATSVRLVAVDASVFDRQTHAPILDLQASDFEIRDEEQPREIVSFGNESGPVDLVFLLDVSGSVREILPQVARESVGALSVLQEGDRSAVMAFSKTTVLTQALSGDASATAEGIRTATRIQIGLDTDINQAVWAAADYLHNKGGSGRRAVLVLTDNMQDTHVPDALVDEQLSEAGAVVDGLLLRSLVKMPHVTHPGILGFARNTGGEVIEATHPDAQLAEMIRRIKFRYSIHFRAAETESGQRRKIRVGLTVEARRRYPNAMIRARRFYFPQGKYRPKPVVPVGHTIAD
jgi:VWFA-related protein